MTALIGVELGLCRLPGNIPDAFAVLHIEVETVGIQRRGIVAITGDPAETGVTVKAVAAGCVGDQSEEVFASEIVDPGKRSARCGDAVFPRCIVKMSELHGKSPFIQLQDGFTPRFENV